VLSSCFGGGSIALSVEHYPTSPLSVPMGLPTDKYGCEIGKVAPAFVSSVVPALTSMARAALAELVLT
jgi:hypothetical protein